MDNLFSDAELKSIEESHALTKQIDELHDKIDELLTPIAEKAWEYTPEQIEALIERFPKGLHRTELRVLLNQRKGE